MKKIILLIFSALVLTANLSSQSIFFSTQEGQTLLYVSMNKKGKINGYTHKTISRVTGSENNFSIDYIVQMLDKNKKPRSKNSELPYTINFADNVLDLHKKSFVVPGRKTLVEITNDALYLPPAPNPGDKMEDLKMTMVFTTRSMKITSNMVVTGRECLAIEEVTVPAGKFKSHKLTKTNTTVITRNDEPFRTIAGTVVSWHAPGIGIVKSESYDKNGKLKSSTVLQSIENTPIQVY
jgi:hypothetical protein